jgi:cobalt-zinc-cadmium efflux system outer membrane protein
MDRHASREPGAVPWIRRDCCLPSGIGSFCLVLIGLGLLTANSGCTSSQGVQRWTGFNPLRASKADSVSRVAESPTDRVEKGATESQPDQTKSGIQLVHNVQNDGNLPTPLDADSPSSTSADDRPTISSMAAELSLSDLQLLAMQNNPTLSQAQAAISAEQGILRQAGLYPNPQIGYLNGSASNPAVKQSNGFFVSQEFVTAHKLDLAQQSALVEIKRYQWDHESQRMRILNDLQIRYYEVLGAQQAMQVTEEMVKIAEKGVSMAQQNLESKHATKTDLLQAKVHLETVRLTRDEAKHRHQAAWGQLATIAGVSPLQPVPLSGDLTSNIPELDFEMSQQHLLANSPQIRSTECDLGHAWATYREARAQACPNFTVQTVGEVDRATQATTISTLVAMPLPIYNRNQGNIDKSSADIIAAQAEISRVQLVLRDQLADSFRRYQTSLRQTERLRDVILPSAKENLELTQQVYAAGETAFTTVLFAQQSYFQNQMAYVEALTELHKVVTEIQGLQLTGGLNPATIGGAIQNLPGGGSQRQRALLNEIQDKASKQLLPAAQISQ